MQLNRRELLGSIGAAAALGLAGCQDSPPEKQGNVSGPSSAKGVANVTQFGAKGDGETNDTQAVRDALEYLQSFDGGRLFFPSGTYILGERGADKGAVFELDKYGAGLEMTGTGYASHLKIADGLGKGSAAGVSLFKGGTNSHIHNIRVDGNKNNQGEIGDRVDGANFVQLGANSHFHNVWSVNSPGDGVEPFGDNVTIDNCIFKDNTEQDVHVWGSNVTVSNNVCLRNEKDGAIRVYSTDTKGGDSRALDISDNVIKNPNTYGIEVNQDGALTTDSRIEGNLLVDCGGKNTALQPDGMHLTTLTNSVVADNTIVNAQRHGIKAEVINGTAITGNVFEDNLIREAGGSGMKLMDGDQMIVRNNVLKENGKQGAQFIFNLSNMPVPRAQLWCEENKIFDNNQDTGSDDAGIQLYAANGTVAGPAFRRNEIASPSGEPLHQNGIKTETQNGGSIDGVTLEDNTIGSVAYKPYQLPPADTRGSVGGNNPRVGSSEG